MTVIEAAALVVLLRIADPQLPAARESLLTPASGLALIDERWPSEGVVQSQPQEPTRPRGWHVRWGAGPSFRYGDAVRLDPHARVRFEALESPVHSGDEDEGAIDIARRRIGVEGELGGALQFEIEREIDSSDPWRDVYVNYRQFAAVRVQGGKFKLPFGLEELVGATNLDFVRRSRAATLLAPGRDRGVMVHGRPFTRLVRYELGVFDHDGRNARVRNPERVFGGTTWAGRVLVYPFAERKSQLADLRAGMAFTTSLLPEGFPALRGQTALSASFYEADVWVNGRRQRTGFEFRWRPGPFSIQSEYIRVTDERRGESVEDTDLSPLVATGWYVSGTWAITGEHKADGLDRPRRPLLPGAGFGAIEVAVRVEGVTFRSAAEGEPPSTSPRADVIAGNGLHGTTVGVNWYVNRWVKFQANVIRERIDDPARLSLSDQSVVWSRAMRVQLAF
ncbi:MAG TPA: porin [Vicinamibacterales bacterium]|nr:porin [Vicinamibacterales bacterium]